MTSPILPDGAELQVIGHRWSPEVHELKAFLARSRVPYRWRDVERDGPALDVAARAGGRGESEGKVAGDGPGAETRLPVVLFPDESALVQPDVRALAERLGLDTEPDDRFYDLIIVGGGPAGLAASVYGASEGLRTVIVEQEVPGGQAGYSASIENYPGFPEGLSGSDFARRTVEQAGRFGVEILVTRRAKRLRPDGQYQVVTLEDGTDLSAHAVLLATGVGFRWLDAPGCQWGDTDECRSLVGAGVYYGAATAEAPAFRNQEVYILGGGNSAGQAALLLAEFARRVVILAQEDTLEATMSRYLVDRIRATGNVAVRAQHSVARAEGSGHLEHLVLQHVKTGATERVPAEGLFIFIGGTPQTEWLSGSVARDARGFILSGPDLMADDPEPTQWRLPRHPYLLETSSPGVFVAGDVRTSSVKRLASAGGEGAMAVQFIHEYCSDR
jgi:thioredoxin reductase (NADPH)